jgi:MOSC domain-containing protein YiiM
MTRTTSWPLLGLYAGTVQPMPGDGRPTGIFKQAVTAPMALGVEGLAGDAQGDRRVHGGPDKALHQFPRPNYARLAEQFPELAAAFVPGSIGENLSVADLDDSQVCIGDVFTLGSARIQLCQPRSPCWKIDSRYGLEGIALFIEKQGLAGWYYRVLEPGTVAPGDTLSLVDRNPQALSLAQFTSLARAHRPHVVDLLRAAALPGLAPGWAQRFRQRAGWLHDHTIAPSPLADEE